MECNFSRNQALLFVVIAQVIYMLHFLSDIWMITIINVEEKKNPATWQFTWLNILSLDAILNGNFKDYSNNNKKKLIFREEDCF